MALVCAMKDMTISIALLIYKNAQIIVIITVSALMENVFVILGGMDMTVQIKHVLMTAQVMVNVL